MAKRSVVEGGHGSPDRPRPGRDFGSGVRPGPQAERAPLDGPSLVFAQATPDPGVLAGFNGPVEAGFHDRTTMTNVLGFVDLEKCWTGVSDRKEQLRIHVTAGGVLGPGQRGHSFVSDR